MGNCWAPRYEPVKRSFISRLSSYADHTTWGKDAHHHYHHQKRNFLEFHLVELCNLPSTATSYFLVEIFSKASNGLVLQTDTLHKTANKLELSATDKRNSCRLLTSEHAKGEGEGEDDLLTIRVFAVYLKSAIAEGIKTLIGQTSISRKELATKREWTLYLFDEEQILVYERKTQEHPFTCKLVVTNFVDDDAAFDEQLLCEKPGPLPPSKSIVVITRGTRGDVQPFLALARGLAEKLNWKVTIVTELAYRGLVKANSKTSQGSIHFRPSGGDTENKLDWFLAKWMLNQRSSIFQFIMLARSEREFFASEPAFAYFAKQAKADMLMFSFNTATVAQILGEAMQIPICGYLLQPTVIPSKYYPSIVSIMDKNDAKKAEEAAADAEFQDSGDYDEEIGYNAMEELKKFLKSQWENNIFTRRLDEMRIANNLEPTAHLLPASFQPPSRHTFREETRPLTVYEALERNNTTLLCPMNELAFGGKPADWGENVRFTDFIYLSKQSDTPLDELRKGNEAVADFILAAKEAQRKIVVITFSSMPISRTAILKLSIKLCSEAETKPCIICVVGKQVASREVTNAALKQEFDALKAEGRVLEISGAPFGYLFPLCDFLILQGGLGTTSEAMRAGKPLLVTGFLVFDQRFWGKRVADLGCGPPAVHIRDLKREIVGTVDKALAPNSVWSKNAELLAAKLAAAGHGDGLQINVDAVAKCLSSDLPPIATPMPLTASSRLKRVWEGEEEAEEEEEREEEGKREQPKPPPADAAFEDEDYYTSSEEEEETKGESDAVVTNL